MNIAGIVGLAVSLLQVVLGNLKAGPVTSDLQLAIAGIQAAIASLEKVQGTPVTYQQLESMRFQPKW